MRNAVIGEDLTIEGDVIAKESRVEVMGLITGDLTAQAVEVLENGRITGTVSAQEVAVRGTLTGNVTCSEISLYETARVELNITTKHMTSVKGARISGKLQVSG